MFTISDQTRQQILEVFDKNEELQKSYGYKTTTKQREKAYLEAKINDSNLEIPSDLRFSTEAGIEWQIQYANRGSSENCIGFGGRYVVYLEPTDYARHVDTMKKEFKHFKADLIPLLTDFMGKCGDFYYKTEHFSINKVQ
jgi:hypothetical protein